MTAFFTPKEREGSMKESRDTMKAITKPTLDPVLENRYAEKFGTLGPIVEQVVDMVALQVMDEVAQERFANAARGGVTHTATVAAVGDAATEAIHAAAPLINEIGKQVGEGFAEAIREVMIERAMEKLAETGKNNPNR
jgi:hypothetical protein